MDSSTGRVLVTGSSGFIGGFVCSELLRRGWSVRGSVRTARQSHTLEPGVQPIVVETCQGKANWDEAVCGVDAVVQLIGRAHVLHDRGSDSLEKYRADNVQVIDGLLRACLQSDVKRLVQLSTIAVVGQGGEIPYTERTKCQPENAYGITKLEAEKLLLESVRGTELEPVILRAPMVYGPGAKGNFPRLLEFIWRGLPLPVGAVCNQRSVLFVRNLSDAVCHALIHPEAGGEVFNVADAKSISTKDLARQIATLMHRPLRALPVPIFALRAMGRLIGREDDIRRFTVSLTLCTRKIREELNWHPPYSIEEGLVESAEWFRATKERGPNA